MVQKSNGEMGGVSLTSLLIGIICLSFGVWFILSHLHIIRIHQALITCNRITSKTHRIIVGPKVVVVWPLEGILLSLDLTMQAAHLKADDIVTTDLAIAASLDILYAFDPVLLQVAKLDEISPVLTEVDRMVRSCADYILRSLAARRTTDDLLTVPTWQGRLQRQLCNTIQSQTHQFGVHIHDIRLLFRPAPTILEARLIATRKQLEAEARAHGLKVLTTVLNREHNMIQEILLLELLQRMQQGNTATAFNPSQVVASKVNDQDPLTMQWILASR